MPSLAITHLCEESRYPLWYTKPNELGELYVVKIDNQIHIFGPKYGDKNNITNEQIDLYPNR